MIIAIANENDGAEKSMLASSLAALRALDGRKVLLIDADPHKFSLAWSSVRDAAGIRPKVPARAIGGKGLQPELENLIPRYDDSDRYRRAGLPGKLVSPGGGAHCHHPCKGGPD